jgi:thiol-disulfide isomerase/thioredoxin
LTRLAFAALAFAATLPAAEIPRKAPELAIKLTPSGEKLLSSMKGKPVVLTFISTTCPHCQQLTATMNRLRAEYGPKGVEFAGVAFNDMSNMLVPDFNRQFRPSYPIGWQSRQVVLDFLQHSPVMQLFVPIIVIIDRTGTIREQHLGDDAAYSTNTELSIRKSLEQVLKSGSPLSSTKKS